MFSAGGECLTIAPSGIGAWCVTADYFEPSYLFKYGDAAITDTDRPSSSKPLKSMAYGEQNMTFPVSFGYGSSAITKVSLIRPASVTHSYDMSQRYVPLTFVTVVTGDSLTITSVPDARVTPPGYYMLFLINEVTTQAEGHPSKADFVMLWGIRDKTVSHTITHAPGSWTLKVEWWTTVKATDGDHLVITPSGGSPDHDYRHHHQRPPSQGHSTRGLVRHTKALPTW